MMIWNFIFFCLYLVFLEPKEWLGFLLVVLCIGNIGGEGRTDTIAEEAEEWKNGDLVFGWDRWDSEQQEAIG